MADTLARYGVSNYNSSTVYKQYDVVVVVSGGHFYYFISRQSGNQNRMSGLTSNAWWFRMDDYTIRFDEMWTPTINTSVDWGARMSDATLGGVNQYKLDGINSILSKASLSFENINDAEARSLVCYYSFIGSRRNFRLMMPDPFNTVFSFKFTTFKHNFITKDRNTVAIGIEQTFAIFGVGAGQEMG